MDLEDNDWAEERKLTMSNAKKANTRKDNKQAGGELNKSSMGIARSKYAKGKV